MNALNGRARDGLALRSHGPCACGDVFYAELGRSNGSAGHCLSCTLKGSQKTKPLMMRHWKSDSLMVVKNPPNNLSYRSRRREWSEAKGTDREEAFSKKNSRDTEHG